MSCLTPGPALVMTRMVPGTPPRRGEPIPAPALPLTTNCWLSASHQIVALRASNSSGVRYAWARSQILGGSVTWASQSKVAKSLVMGANVCTGMLCFLSTCASDLAGERVVQRHLGCAVPCPAAALLPGYWQRFERTKRHAGLIFQLLC